MDARVCVARIGAAHGVRGEVRLWTFTDDPLAVLHYGALTTKDGARSLRVTQARAAKDHLVATLDGVSDRDAAEQLNGVELFVPRAALPAADDDEFYHADLVGCDAVTINGDALGRVIAVHNFGAGDIIEIAPPHGPTLLLPFTRAIVPSIDLALRCVVIDPPDEIEGEKND